MQAYWTLTRRELGAYFCSLTGYLIIAAAMFLMGYSFWLTLHQLQQLSTPMPVTELFFRTPYFWLILILTPPVITMRLFALEKSSGTFETLMTAPVGDTAVVLAKYTAAWVFHAVVWLPLLGCLLVVRHYTDAGVPFDPSAACSTFLGICLLGGVMIAIGCLASALTRNQSLAAMISLMACVSLFLLAYLADQFPDGQAWQPRVLACFSFFEQMRDFVRGIVDTRFVILYTSLAFLFLFLTIRVVESRRWK
jgi:ABC-2 type transport system permease protein